MHATPAQTRTILIGAATMMTVAMGMRQSLGLFLTPITHDLGLTAADFTFAVAMQNLAWGATQAFVGAFADRRGARPVMMAGTVVYALGVVAMLLAHGLPMVLLSNVLIGAALSCTASSLAMTATARAVPESRRSRTLGMVSAVGSLGTLMIAPLVQKLIIGVSWQAGAALFLVLVLAFQLPAAFCAGAVDKLPARDRTGVSMRTVLGQAARHRGFLVMSAAYFVCGLQLVFLTTHLPTYLNICGMNPMLGAEALAVIGGMNAVGSWLFGWLGGRYPKHILLGTLYLCRSAALFAYFVMPPTPASTLAFAAVMGLLWLAVGAAHQRHGRRHVRHPLHGDAAGNQLHGAPGRLVPRRLGRGADLHRSRLL